MFEDFSCFLSWETETRKNSPKIPARGLLEKGSFGKGVFQKGPFPRGFHRVDGCVNSRFTKLLVYLQMCLSGSEKGVFWKRGLSERSISQRRRDDNKNKIFGFWGGGAWGQRGKSSKTLFFVGNAATIKFWKCKFYCRKILLSLRRLLVSEGFHRVDGCVLAPRTCLMAKVPQISEMLRYCPGVSQRATIWGLVARSWTFRGVFVGLRGH